MENTTQKYFILQQLDCWFYGFQVAGFFDRNGGSSQVWSPWNERKGSIATTDGPSGSKYFPLKNQAFDVSCGIGLWIIGAVILSNDIPEICGQLKKLQQIE